jgi:uncharacterized protein
MRHRFWFRILLATGSMCFFVFMGCAGITAPSRFYILSSIDKGETVQTMTDVKSSLAVGIGPVTISDYLDRPQIVIRSGHNKLELADFDKWAGSLKSNIECVLAENLSILLSIDRVFIYPWNYSMPLDYRVAVEIIRFDGMPGEKAELKARWILSDTESREVLVVKQPSFSEPVDGVGYETFVAAQSKTIESLSIDIAKTILNDMDHP